MPTVAIVNASSILHDDTVRAVVPDLQAQIDQDFYPAWNTRADLVFVPFGSKPPSDSWPLYLNRHSTDPGALGWHDDQAGLIYGRVFVGDCLKYGLSWTVDLTHELLEVLGDPKVDQFFKMADGRIACHELADAVEDEIFAYHKGQTLVTDFVLPAYFGPPIEGGRYDFMGHLQGPCPTLTSGGYMSIYDGKRWTQLNARLASGAWSVRALRNGRGNRHEAPQS